jgi:hypothetical protein
MQEVTRLIHDLAAMSPIPPVYVFAIVAAALVWATRKEMER